MKIRRPDFSLSYMKSEKQHGHLYDRKKNYKQRHKATHQLTVNALVVLERKLSALTLPSAERDTIIDVDMIDTAIKKER